MPSNAVGGVTGGSVGERGGAKLENSPTVVDPIS